MRYSSNIFEKAKKFRDTGEDQKPLISIVALLLTTKAKNLIITGESGH